MKLPEQQSLTLAQLPTPQLRTLAAFSGLEAVDAIRPALLQSLRDALSRHGKQQWIVQNAQVSLPKPVEGMETSGNHESLYAIHAEHPSTKICLTHAIMCIDVGLTAPICR